MAEFIDWNINPAAAPNTSPSPDGAPEGMGPAGLNDTIREHMAVRARWRADNNGSLTAGGAPDNYTLTPNAGIVAYQEGLTYTFQVGGGLDNTGPSTLEVDSNGAVDILHPNGEDLVEGDLVEGGVYSVVYSGTTFKLTSSSRTGSLTQAEISIAQVANNFTVTSAHVLNGGIRLANSGVSVLTLPANVNAFWPVGATLRIYAAGNTRDCGITTEAIGGAFVLYRSYNGLILTQSHTAVGTELFDESIDRQGFAEIVRLNTNEYFVWK